MRDREIYEWLTDTAEWLRRGNLTADQRQGGGGHHHHNTNTASAGASCAELRFLILGVLHTMPWWRIVMGTAPGRRRETDSLIHSRPSEEVDGRQRRSTAPQSAAAAVRAMARWHLPIQIAFEKVCLELIQQSQHTVPAVMEVAMRTFHLRHPVRDGAVRAIPADSLLRLLNAVATKYSASYVLDLLQQCLSQLIPKRRWPDRRHHVACTAIFLHLSLEAHIPAYSYAFGNEQCLVRAHELMHTLHVSSLAEHKVSGGVSELPALQLPAGNDTPWASSVGMATSGESGTDCASGSAHSQLIAPTRNILAGASDVDGGLSDLGSRLSESSLRYPGADGTRSLVSDGPGAGTHSSPQNNKLLTYRREIIRFILQRLLEMELMLEPPQLQRCGDPLGSGSEVVSASSPMGCGGVALSLPSSPTPQSAANAATWPQTPTFQTDALPLFGRGAPSSSVLSPASLLHLHILNDCTTVVFDRLAEDLRRQQAAGVCGNAEWWRELIAFHLNAILQIENPVCLPHLAPSLAMLGSGDEPIDLLHKVLTLVMKGVRPVQQTQPPSAAGRSGTGGYPQRLRMAPPSLSTQTVPPAQRLRAALMIFPLFRFMKDRIDNGEGARKRIIKYVAREVALHEQLHNNSTTGEPTTNRKKRSPPPPLTDALGPPPHGAEPLPEASPSVLNYQGTSSHTHSGIPKLAQVLFAQAAAMSALMGVSLVPRSNGAPPPPQSPAPGTPGETGASGGDYAEDLLPLLTRYTLKDCGSVEKHAEADGKDDPVRLDLAQMEREGLLRWSMGIECPWADLLASKLQ